MRTPRTRKHNRYRKGGREYQYRKEIPECIALVKAGKVDAYRAVSDAFWTAIRRERRRG